MTSFPYQGSARKQHERQHCQPYDQTFFFIWPSIMSQKALINSELSQVPSPENRKTIPSSSTDVINSDPLLLLQVFKNKRAGLTKGSSFGSLPIFYKDPPLSAPPHEGFVFTGTYILLISYKRNESHKSKSDLFVGFSPT